jgi:hypothetical protein
MNLCSKLIEAVKYLDGKGMSEMQLSKLHHFSVKGRNETYAQTYRYFGESKELRERNTNYANRLIFIAEKYKAGAGSFSVLSIEALQRWPLHKS